MLKNFFRRTTFTNGLQPHLTLKRQGLFALTNYPANNLGNVSKDKRLALVLKNAPLYLSELVLTYLS